MYNSYPPFYADQEKYGKKTDDRIFELICKGFDPATKPGYGSHFPQAIPAGDSAKDLISKLLNSNTAERLTAAEALEHRMLFCYINIQSFIIHKHSTQTVHNNYRISLHIICSQQVHI